MKGLFRKINTSGGPLNLYAPSTELTPAEVSQILRKAPGSAQANYFEVLFERNELARDVAIWICPQDRLPFPGDYKINEESNGVSLTRVGEYNSSGFSSIQIAHVPPQPTKGFWLPPAVKIKSKTLNYEIYLGVYSDSKGLMALVFEDNPPWVQISRIDSAIEEALLLRKEQASE
jgi:hypothetical protein